MAFSEKIKRNVKEKAAFMCCRCHEIGVDVHHIIPLSKGGTDKVDNAASLCQNCHDRYGDNQTKRKEIKQMRDWWNEVVKEKYSPNDTFLKKLAEIDKNINNYQLTTKQYIDNLMKDISKIFLPQKGDSKKSTKRKITTLVTLAPNIYLRKVYCPACKKDLTAEIELEHPGVTNDNPINKLYEALSSVTILKPRKEIIIDCPYCNKRFNLKNV